MGKLSSYNPIKETEYLLQKDLLSAERDDTMKYLASTLERSSGKLRMGTGSDGPRILNFAPLLTLNEIPINSLIIKLLKQCEEAVKAPVEIEFAVSLSNSKNKKHQFGFLQVRPMVVSNEDVIVNESELISDNVLASSENVLGNGIIDDLVDVVKGS